jgi:hypothetical protein
MSAKNTIRYWLWRWACHREATRLIDELLLTRRTLDAAERERDEAKPVLEAAYQQRKRADAIKVLTSERYFSVTATDGPLTEAKYQYAKACDMTDRRIREFDLARAAGEEGK